MRALSRVGSAHAERAALEARVCRSLGEINAVANVRGRGSAEGIQVEVLERAREVVRETEVAKSVGRLALRVIETFERYLELIWKYSTNLELVDP